METIIIPVNNTDIESMRIICEHFELEVKECGRDRYKVTGEPINLFWLGCNIHHKLNGTQPKI